MRLQQIPYELKSHYKGGPQAQYEQEEAVFKENMKWAKEQQKWQQRQQEHDFLIVQRKQ